MDTGHLTPGLLVDVDNDWRVFVVDADAHNSDVFYVGSYPYDGEGHPLHPNAPAIVATWNGQVPGARQISERQKRFDRLMTPVLFEPVPARLHA